MSDDKKHGPHGEGCTCPEESIYHEFNDHEDMDKFLNKFLAPITQSENMCHCGTKKDALEVAAKNMLQMSQNDCIIWAIQVAMAHSYLAMTMAQLIPGPPHPSGKPIAFHDVAATAMANLFQSEASDKIAHDFYHKAQAILEAKHNKGPLN